jgi:hypothetical protein
LLGVTPVPTDAVDATLKHLALVTAMAASGAADACSPLRLVERHLDVADAGFKWLLRAADCGDVAAREPFELPHGLPERCESPLTFAEVPDFIASHPTRDCRAATLDLLRWATSDLAWVVRDMRYPPTADQILDFASAHGYATTALTELSRADSGEVL